MRRLLILALLLCPLPATLSAEGLSLHGRAGIGTTDTGDHGVIAPIDLTLAIPLAHDTALELGTFAYVLSDKRPHETYAALRWRGLRVGVVRPAYDSVLPSVFDLAAPHLAYAEAETTRAYTTTRAMRVNAVPVGLSYRRDAGPLRWRLSLHDDTKGTFRSISAALRWQHGAVTVAAAVEAVDANGTTRSNAKLGLRWTSDRLDAGLALYRPEASGQPDALAFDLGLRATDRLRLTLLGEATRGGMDDTLGLAAGWRLTPDTTLDAAALRHDSGGSLHLTLNRGF